MQKYDKEATFRIFHGWLQTFIRILLYSVFSLSSLYSRHGSLSPSNSTLCPSRLCIGFDLFCFIPRGASDSKHKLYWYDVLLSAAGAAVSIYIVWNYDVIVLDAGPPTRMDFILAAQPFCLFLKPQRRIVGLPITIIAVTFLLYAKFGNLIPGMLGHPGFSFTRIVGHMYLYDRRFVWNASWCGCLIRISVYPFGAFSA